MEKPDIKFDAKMQARFNELSAEIQQQIRFELDDLTERIQTYRKQADKISLSKLYTNNFWPVSNTNCKLMTYLDEPNNTLLVLDIASI